VVSQSPKSQQSLPGRWNLICTCFMSHYRWATTKALHSGHSVVHWSQALQNILIMEKWGHNTGCFKWFLLMSACCILSKFCLRTARMERVGSVTGIGHLLSCRGSIKNKQLTVYWIDNRKSSLKFKNKTRLPI
jgi:hypothetical protein